MHIKFVAFWGMMNTSPLETIEEAIARVPVEYRASERTFWIEAYPGDVHLRTDSGLPDKTNFAWFKFDRTPYLVRKAKTPDGKDCYVMANA